MNTVMPSIGELRNAIDEIMESINMLELVQELKSGDRIGAYQPFADWLKKPERGNLYIQQMADLLIYEISRQGDKEKMASIAKTAVNYLQRM